MSKIVVALAWMLPLVLVGCGGGSSSAPLLTSPTNPESPTGSTSSSTTFTSQTITFSPANMAVGSSVSLQGTASSGLPVTYTSQTPTVCTVSGSTLTALALGTCGIVANQAGNATYSAAPQISSIIAVLSAQSINNFSTLNLTVGGLATLSPTATSGLPVTITSATQGVCTVGSSNIAITGVAAGQCILIATQAGNVQYATAPYVVLSATVTAPDTALVHTAQLTPWFTVSPATPTPQAGSTAADSTTTLEGIYANSSSGAYALIDSSNHFNYMDYYGYLFGSLIPTTNAWTLDSSATYYPATSSSTSPSTLTANGTFVLKQSFTGISQSFTTITSPLSLIYMVDNGYAASQADVAKSWLYNNGSQQLNLTVNSVGTIAGTEIDSTGGMCSMSGSIVQTEPASQHNMYSITLNASSISGSFCNIDTTHPYVGLAAISFLSAGTNTSNGSIPVLAILAQNAAASSPLQLTFYPQP